MVFWDQSIGIVETNTFQLTFFSRMNPLKSIEIRHLPAILINGYVGRRQVYALWALEWAWQTIFGVNRYVLTILIHFS